MTPPMETIRVFLDDHRRGVIRCPHCGDTQAITIAQYPAPLGGKACQMLCGACGRVFRLIFDGRRHLRIPVSLPGTLFPSTPEDSPDELCHKLGYTTITVTSLAAGGIGFRPQTPVSCNVDDRFHVIFVLPDTNRSMICEDIVIRRSDPQEVGRRSVVRLARITPSTGTSTSRPLWPPPPVAGRPVDRPRVSQPPPPRYSLLPGAPWLAFPPHTDAFIVNAMGGSMLPHSHHSAVAAQLSPHRLSCSLSPVLHLLTRPILGRAT